MTNSVGAEAAAAGPGEASEKNARPRVTSNVVVIKIRFFIACPLPHWESKVANMVLPQGILCSSITSLRP
jgi:hypothetical protein